MSEKLIKEYQKLHSKRTGYGDGDPRIVGPIKKAIEVSENPEPFLILDYGCGRSRLMEDLKFDDLDVRMFYRYDPAIEEYSEKPWEEFEEGIILDLVLCNDVLEHIPDEELDAMFEEIRSISNMVIFIIHCAKASTILSNGENAHCTVNPPAWWKDRLERFWPNTLEFYNNYPKVGFRCC